SVAKRTAVTIRLSVARAARWLTPATSGWSSIPPGREMPPFVTHDGCIFQPDEKARPTGGSRIQGVTGIRIRSAGGTKVADAACHLLAETLKDSSATFPDGSGLAQQESLYLILNFKCMSLGIPLRAGPADQVRRQTVTMQHTSLWQIQKKAGCRLSGTSSQSRQFISSQFRSSRSRRCSAAATVCIRRPEGH